MRKVEKEYQVSEESDLYYTINNNVDRMVVLINKKETIKWDDGNEYPLFKIEISDKSHPFFTGQQNLVDAAGRIEKFQKKYGKNQ